MNALPPGHYTVQLPQQGGLVDLAGLSPVAPGEPAGVLGDFDVSATKWLPAIPRIWVHFSPGPGPGSFCRAGAGAGRSRYLPSSS